MVTTSIISDYKHFVLFDTILKLNYGLDRILSSFEKTREKLSLGQTSIANPFLNPELKNTTYLEKWGTLYAIILPKNN